MDRNAGASGETCERTLNASRCNEDLAALDIDHAAIAQAGRMEVDANAAAIRGEDSCK